MPIDPYTGKESVFLPTDSLVRAAEKGDPQARHIVDAIGCAAMLVILTSLVVLGFCAFITVRGLITGDWSFHAE